MLSLSIFDETKVGENDHFYQMSFLNDMIFILRTFHSWPFQMFLWRAFKNTRACFVINSLMHQWFILMANDSKIRMLILLQESLSIDTFDHILFFLLLTITTPIIISSNKIAFKFFSYFPIEINFFFYGK